VLKRLVLVIVIATLAYSGWWFFAANDLRRSVEAWFEDQRAAGWDAGFSDIAVRGFPNRTDLTLTDPHLRSPDGTFGWQAPFIQILGLSYKRGHVIIAWPNTQTLQTPQGPVDISSERLRASVIFRDDLVLRSNLEADVLNLADPDQTMALAGITAALEKVELSETEYRAALAIDGLAVSDPSITGTHVPDALATLRADTTLDLSTPLSLASLTNEPPQIDRLTLRNTQVDYGTLRLKLAGETAFDPQGRATGEVTIEAQNWRDALRNAQDNGTLPPGVSDALLDILTMIASLNGARDALDVTLGLDRGTVLLGPLPIGRLPPLQWP
jgi:hypothetical protein